MSCAKSCRAGLKCWAYNPESDICYESGEETDRPSPLSVSAWTGTTALFRKKYLTAAHARCIIIVFQVCRCDGIGRRSGLKIHRWRQRAGSSPATGTRSDGCESLFSHPFFCIAMVITACTQKRTTAVFSVTVPSFLTSYHFGQSDMKVHSTRSLTPMPSNSF